MLTLRNINVYVLYSYFRADKNRHFRVKPDVIVIQT